MNDSVNYEERDGIAIIAINRPEKKNTLTESVVAGIADGIDAATRSEAVSAIVLRGTGDTFTAGYDLTQREERFDPAFGEPVAQVSTPDLPDHLECGQHGNHEPCLRQAVIQSAGQVRHHVHHDR